MSGARIADKGKGEAPDERSALLPKQHLMTEEMPQITKSQKPSLSTLPPEVLSIITKKTGDHNGTLRTLRDTSKAIKEQVDKIPLELRDKTSHPMITHGIMFPRNYADGIDWRKMKQRRVRARSAKKWADITKKVTGCMTFGDVTLIRDCPCVSCQPQHAPFVFCFVSAAICSGLAGTMAVIAACAEDYFMAGILGMTTGGSCACGACMLGTNRCVSASQSRCDRKSDQAEEKYGAYHRLFLSTIPAKSKVLREGIAPRVRF